MKYQVKFLNVSSNKVLKGYLMGIFARSLFGVAAAAFSLSTFAALPQPGLWVIDNELNGNPGRGLQIERQNGKTIVVSYFGYRSDGSAVFYQSVGEVSKDGIFNADFIEYKNGPVIGGDVQNGEISSVLGKLNVDFKTSASGVISIPGEDARNFSRFIYQDGKSRLNNKYLITKFQPSYPAGFSEAAEMKMEISGDNFFAESYTKSRTCKYTGNIERKGSAYYSVGRVECDPDYNLAVRYYVFSDIRLSDSGDLTMYYSDSLSKLPDETLTNDYLDSLFGVCIMKPRPYATVRCASPNTYLGVQY